MTALQLDALTRDFGSGDGIVRALDGVTLGFERGTFTAVMGPSGSGKSTLLQLAAGLDRPTQGHVHLAEHELGGLNERALARLRRERIGFVFQSFNLLGALTAEQNEAIGWRNRQGVTDGRTFFNYYRLTSDNRVLWGTSEAVYYSPNRVEEACDHYSLPLEEFLSGQNAVRRGSRGVRTARDLTTFVFPYNTRRKRW